MTLRCLFVDFDSFFASVEQFDDPRLRGRAIGVVPVLAETTCCIAASQEAKRLGIRTGTGVREARERCPDITLVLARPARYVELHLALMAAIQECVPHGTPNSIDEVPCDLIGRERRRENAEAIARAIKQRLRDLGFSPAINCSIGIAPNKFLAKTASDMDKPDGLTVLEQADLPQALHRLELRDLCGIGPSMEQRLHAAGIETVEQLCVATRQRLRAAWGSIEGERFWLQLRGFDIPERTTRRASIGHSHVLGPELRSFEGARAVLFKLLSKAAMRMRNDRYLAGGMSIRIRFLGLEQRFAHDLSFAPIDDTPTLLSLLGRTLERLRRARVRGHWHPARFPPLSVAVTLSSLEPSCSVTTELMPQRDRARAMSAVLDSVNRRYGNNALYFGAMQEALAHGAAPMRIPFSVIPETALEQDVAPASRRGGGPPGAGAADLWTLRERQFRVLAEQSHRQAEAAQRPHVPAGTGAWTNNLPGQPHVEQARARSGELAPGTTGNLF